MGEWLSGSGGGSVIVTKRVLFTDRAPRASALYSQGIAAGGFVFTAQVGLDASGSLVEGGPGEQARQCLKNVSAVLDAAGCGLPDVVQVTIYLTDLAAVAEVNEAYAESFPLDPPSRACVEVAALPPGVLVEMQVIARAEKDAE
jgi:2-iminobutanoate/2-iminopropanoate deaminase